jgi:PAS domain S-box-containing protein
MNKKLLGLGLLGAVAAGIAIRTSAISSLLSMNYLPHRFCYLAQPGLVWTNVVTDGLIAVSYALIFGCLFWLVNKLRSVPQLRGYLWIFISFGSFVLACGVTHLMEVVTVWWPLYPLSAAAKVLCAAVSIPTAIMFLRATPGLAENLLRYLAGLAQARRAEEDAAANYRGQVEAINRSAMMIEFGLDGTILKVNEKYLRVLDYAEAELTGKHHSIFVAEPYQRSAEYTEFWNALKRGEFHAGLFARMDRLGREVWLEGAYNAILGPDGVPVKVVKFAADVTERMKTRDALEEASTRNKVATESGQIGIWDWNLVNEVLTWDALMRKLYGIAADDSRECSYERWQGFLHPEDRGWATAEFQASLQSALPLDTGFRVVWEDGSIHHLRATGQVSRDESGKPTRVVGATWDITDLIVAGETARAATKVATESSRIKSDFLANMSHEIRTPMNAILGMTHLALRADPAPRQAAYLNKIANAAESLLSIMNDILDFSKIEAGKLALEYVTFSLEDVWNDVIDIVGEKAGKKDLAIRFSIFAETPKWLIGDPLRLGQILINLVNNAVKFTEQGEITVTVTADVVAADEGRLRFAVQDPGIGMSAKQVANLFQSFNQADTSYTRKYGGTGLGLAISKQLCEMMGGTIGVQSEPGRGSTFSFTTTLGIACYGMPVVEQVRRRDLQKDSILVVDDSESARHGLVSMLQKHGYLTRSVSSGEEALLALQSASQTGEPFDLVLLDWRLPGIDGIETARRIKKQLGLPRSPAILMVSAFDRDEVMNGLLGAYLDGFVVKPIHEGTLLSQVARILTKTPGQAEEAAVANAERPVSELAGTRVLLVEDNEINRELAAELLGDLGIAVTIAVNGLEGVQKLASESFDLVLMDIQMPVMDGLTATRQIRQEERFRKLPVVAMTAHAMSGDRERSLAAGMNDHLTKPISSALLTGMLLRWMPGKAELLDRTVAVVSQVSAVPVDGLPEQLPPFNLKLALQRANGKPKLLRKMLLNFNRQYADAAETMRGYIGGGQSEEAHRLAHSLKGVAATLEANELADAAAAVEQAYRSGETGAVPLLVQRMEEKLKLAILAVRTLVAPVSVDLS